MNDIIEFLTSKEIMVIYILGLVTAICFIGFYIRGKNKLKRIQRQNTKELKSLVADVSKEEKKFAKSISVEKETKSNAHAIDTLVAIEEIEPTPVKEKIEVQDLKNQIETAIVEEVRKETEPIKKAEEKPLVWEVKMPTVKTTIPEVIAPPKVVVAKTEIKETPIEPIKEEIKPLEEEIEYTDIELKKDEAKLELEKLVEELKKAEEVTNNIELTSFEEEQEENAIISLDELLKKSATIYEENEATQYDDEAVPISLADLENKMKTVTEIKTNKDSEILEPVIVNSTIVSEPLENILEENPKIILQDFANIKEPIEQAQTVVAEVKKITDTYKRKNFTSAPVISPIFGIELKEVNDNELALENTANFEKLDEEIRKTNEFLATLKELQKKLD